MDIRTEQSAERTHITADPFSRSAVQPFSRPISQATTARIRVHLDRSTDDSTMIFQSGLDRASEWRSPSLLCVACHVFHRCAAARSSLRSACFQILPTSSEPPAHLDTERPYRHAYYHFAPRSIWSPMRALFRDSSIHISIHIRSQPHQLNRFNRSIHQRRGFKTGVLALLLHHANRFIKQSSSCSSTRIEHATPPAPAAAGAAATAMVVARMAAPAAVDRGDAAAPAPGLPSNAPAAAPQPSSGWCEGINVVRTPPTHPDQSTPNRTAHKHPHPTPPKLCRPPNTGSAAPSAAPRPPPRQPPPQPPCAPGGPRR